MLPSHPFKIFLADDDLFSLKMYELYLRVIGYKNISLYNDGQSCLQDLQQQPDIIFLDHSLDTGADCPLVKQIKAFNPDIYIVLLCSPGSRYNTDCALASGAFDYITKGDDDLDAMKAMLQRIARIKETLNNQANTLGDFRALPSSKKSE